MTTDARAERAIRQRHLRVAREVSLQVRCPRGSEGPHRLSEPQAAAREARLLAQALRAGAAGRVAARSADARRLRAEAAWHVLQRRELVFAAHGLPALPGELGG